MGTIRTKGMGTIRMRDGYYKDQRDKIPLM